MYALRSLFLTAILALGCCPLGGCATIVGRAKAPPDVWEKLAGGMPLDLIVEFNDSSIQAQASKLNKAKGITFDDGDTMRFRAERYAAIKQDAMSTLPPGKVEILKNYDVLPLMFLRFHSTAALKALLAHPSVVRAYEDRKENLMPRNSRP